MCSELSCSIVTESRLAADMPFHPFRAIIVRNGEIIPMSSEFTPETERQRLQYLVRASEVRLDITASGMTLGLCRGTRHY